MAYAYIDNEKAKEKKVSVYDHAILKVGPQHNEILAYTFKDVFIGTLNFQSVSGEYKGHSFGESGRSYHDKILNDILCDNTYRAVLFSKKSPEKRKIIDGSEASVTVYFLCTIEEQRLYENEFDALYYENSFLLAQIYYWNQDFVNCLNVLDTLEAEQLVQDEFQFAKLYRRINAIEKYEWYLDLACKKGDGDALKEYAERCFSNKNYFEAISLYEDLLKKVPWFEKSRIQDSLDLARKLRNNQIVEQADDFMNFDNARKYELLEILLQRKPLDKEKCIMLMDDLIKDDYSNTKYLYAVYLLSNKKENDLVLKLLTESAVKGDSNAFYELIMLIKKVPQHYLEILYNFCERNCLITFDSHGEKKKRVDRRFKNTGAISMLAVMYHLGIKTSIDIWLSRNLFWRVYDIHEEFKDTEKLISILKFIDDNTNKDFMNTIGMLEKRYCNDYSKAEVEAYDELVKKYNIIDEEDEVFEDGSYDYDYSYIISDEEEWDF